MQKIAILGSGQVGAALARGFLDNGYAVMRASREPEKLAAWKSEVSGEASVGTFADAARWGDVVVLCVKGLAAEALVGDHAASLSGKTVIDATNPISDEKADNGVIRYFTGPNESLMERLQRRAPGARFVKAFNSVGNTYMVNPPFRPTATMFICGDDPGAKQETTRILEQFGWEVADMGGVEAARPIEALCQLWCASGFNGSGWNHAFKFLSVD